MRIAYLGPLPPLTGGISQHGRFLVDALSTAGHQVDTWSWRSPYPGLLYKGQQKDPEALPFPGARFTMRWWDPVSWLRTGRSIRGYDFALIQWVTPVHGLPLIAAMRALAPTPVVCIVHNVTPHERFPMDSFITKQALQHASMAVVHSNFQDQELRRLIPGIRTIQLEMPAHVRSNAPLPPPRRPPFRLIQPGYVRPYKGVDVALNALRIFLDAPAAKVTHLTIAGDFWSPSEDEVRDQIAALGLQDHVTIVAGYMSDEEMIRQISDHHAALLPYTSATQSGIIPASLEAGRPVITTDVGGLPEQVRNGVDGIICAPSDPHCLARAMDTMYRDYSLYQQATLNGQPNWGDVASRIAEAGKSLIRR